jgi:hypothetical protein
MEARQLLIHTEAWVQEEIVAQKRLSSLLADQERAIVTGDTPDLTETSQAIERELAGSVPRDRRRRELVDGFARVWGIPAGAMSLSSIAERLGNEARRLVTLRRELRGVVADVLRRGRRISAMAQHHQGLLRDVMHLLAGAGDDRNKDHEGALVNAEA